MPRVQSLANNFDERLGTNGRQVKKEFVAMVCLTAM